MCTRHTVRSTVTVRHRRHSALPVVYSIYVSSPVPVPVPVRLVCATPRVLTHTAGPNASTLRAARRAVRGRHRRHDHRTRGHLVFGRDRACRIGIGLSVGLFFRSRPHIICACDTPSELNSPTNNPINPPSEVTARRNAGTCSQVHDDARLPRRSQTKTSASHPRVRAPCSTWLSYSASRGPSVGPSPSSWLSPLPSMVQRSLVAASFGSKRPASRAAVTRRVDSGWDP